MRLGSLFSTFALIVATLGLPAQQLCGLSAAAGARPAAVASSCCGADHCCPRGHCSCHIGPQSGTDEKSVAAPSPVTDGSAFATTPVAVVTVPPDTDLETRLVASEVDGPKASHAFCPSNRAPPQS